MDKRESRPRELTEEETKAVAGGDGLGHAFGQEALPSWLVNLGVNSGPKKKS
jgi:hypothetical protein